MDLFQEQPGLGPLEAMENIAMRCEMILETEQDGLTEDELYLKLVENGETVDRKVFDNFISMSRLTGDLSWDPRSGKIRP